MFRGTSFSIIAHCIVAIFLAIFSAFIFILLQIWNSLPVIQSMEQLFTEQSIIIHDRQGNELFRLFNDKDRFVVEAKDLPSHVTESITAIEDERFWERSCIDIQAISRAFVANLQDEKSQGGSTITQQLVRSIFLSNEKTYSRKAKELLIACKMELTFSKEEILNMYMNWISFGGSNYGIEQASTSYFNKHASELTIAEASILAALPQRPTYFSPYGPHKHSQLTENTFTIGLLPSTAQTGSGIIRIPGRSSHVLANMKRLNYITQAELQVAEAELTTIEFAPVGYSINAPHFVFWLRSQLEQATTSGNGLEVTSTIHDGLQAIAERAVNAHLAEITQKYNAHNVSLLAVDRHTKEILAYVGNADYFSERDGQVDMIQSARQPGSSFKPIVYAAAFMNGIDPASFVQDEPITLGGYTPKNYEGGYFGRMTIRDALSRSRNIPAIKAFFWAGGEEPIVALADRIGIHTPLSQKNAQQEKNKSFTYGWPLALGSAEVSLFEMVQAYSVFASKGQMTPLSGIRIVRNSNGKVVEVQKTNQQISQRMPASVASSIDEILSSEESRPEGFWRDQLTLPGGSAAKTGTSSRCLDQTPEGCKKIAATNTWVIGYNKDYIVGVWVGNANGEILTGEASGLTSASPIWKDFMEQASLFSSK